MNNFKQLCQDLEKEIQISYESGVTMDDAEKLAAKFLYAQIQVSAELKKADLDSRLRKTGVKAIRAAVYMDAATKSDRRPTEAALVATIDLNDLVQDEQSSFDNAEVERNDLERYYNVFINAHIFFRNVNRGKFE